MTQDDRKWNERVSFSEIEKYIMLYIQHERFCDYDLLQVFGVESSNELSHREKMKHNKELKILYNNVKCELRKFSIKILKDFTIKNNIDNYFAILFNDDMLYYYYDYFKYEYYVLITCISDYLLKYESLLDEDISIVKDDFEDSVSLINKVDEEFSDMEKYFKNFLLNITDCDIFINKLISYLVTTYNNRNFYMTIESDESKNIAKKQILILKLLGIHVIENYCDYYNLDSQSLNEKYDSEYNKEFEQIIKSRL